MVGIGIDFGTSNSAAAWFDGNEVKMISLSSNIEIIPTAVHLNREYQTETGVMAVQRYVEENRGRKVEMVAEVIGQASTSVQDPLSSDSGEADNRNNIYGQLIDRSLPGRLFLGVKRLLGNETLLSLRVFDKDFRLVALITPILLKIREAIEATVKVPVNKVHIGRPVEFEGKSSDKNSVAIARLAEACSYASHNNVKFYPEPVAATLSYLFGKNSKDEGIVLAVDFGGGTLDFSLIKYACGSQQLKHRENENNFFHFDVLATRGVAVAGDHIDQLIFKALIFPELGKNSLWTRRVDGEVVETPFPFEEYEQGLLNWAITHTLNQNQYTARLADLSDCGTETATKLERLQEVIQYNYSFNIFSAIKKAKAQLSEVEETILNIPELDLSIPFERVQLNEIIMEVMVLMDQSISQLLNESGVDISEINRVVRTGGSSKLISVIELLEQYFPGKVVQHDPFTGVAAGLAIANYYNYSHEN